MSLLYIWVNINNNQHTKPKLESFDVDNDTILGTKLISKKMTPKKIVAKTKEFIEKSEVLNTNTFNSTNFQSEADVFVESFWYWTKFRNYLFSLLVIILALSGLTYLLKEQQYYVELLGILSSLIEAMLGLP
jgi:hypothetical protein